MQRPRCPTRRWPTSSQSTNLKASNQRPRLTCRTRTSSLTQKCTQLLRSTYHFSSFFTFFFLPDHALLHAGLLSFATADVFLRLAVHGGERPTNPAICVTNMDQLQSNRHAHVPQPADHRSSTAYFLFCPCAFCMPNLCRIRGCLFCVHWANCVSL
jgi:hypothetical protein